MDKITNFMRVTKKRKALEGATSDIVKPPLSLEKPTAPVATLKKLKVQETDADGELYEHGIHVPTFIYDTVKYTRQSAPHDVDATTQRVVAYIQRHFDVPVDFETSRRYGPHSGLTYESRLLRAYKLKLLTPKNDRKTAIAPICLTCAAEGHVDRDCPDGF